MKEEASQWQSDPSETSAAAKGDVSPVSPDASLSATSSSATSQQPTPSNKKAVREKLAARKLVGQSFVTQTPFFSTNDLELEVDQGEDVTILEQVLVISFLIFFLPG
jgi:hypothetical protein